MRSPNLASFTVLTTRHIPATPCVRMHAPVQCPMQHSPTAHGPFHPSKWRGVNFPSVINRETLRREVEQGNKEGNRAIQWKEANEDGIEAVWNGVLAGTWMREKERSERGKKDRSCWVRHAPLCCYVQWRNGEMEQERRNSMWVERKRPGGQWGVAMEVACSERPC